LGVIVFLPLGASSLRWVNHTETFLLFPYTAFGVAVILWIKQQFFGLGAQILRSLCVVLLFVWFWLPAIGVTLTDNVNGKPRKTECPVGLLTAILTDPTGLGAESKRILAFVDFGPELLYRTPHAVFSIPTGRKQPGFVMSYKVMTATDFEIAEKLLRENGVDLIITCPGSVEESMYSQLETGPTLYKALAKGEIPHFLKPVPLSRETATIFKMFEVRAW